ncbi:MAG: hydrolase [Gammaproteobacteria bacterium]|nr:hydrolase [Gammaproteobacteria bacterium]
MTKRGSIVPCDFRPAWWLAGPHLQTVWPALVRRTRPVSLTRERLELPDGDFVDIDWTGESGPIVVILHGLQGSSRSPHVQGLLGALVRRGWRGAVMHFRGCSGEPNRLPRTYHSGETGDVGYLLGRLRERHPSTPVAAVGYSLGGNVLLKWLAERGPDAELSAAVAVSVPFRLDRAAERLERGFSRAYKRHFIADLHRTVLAKFRQRPGPLDLDAVRREWSFRGFDNHVTAPLHGFRDAGHYYAAASCRQYLRGVTRPTLIVHALDDPFMTRDAVPRREELAPSIRLELSATGGHVGFVEGRAPWSARYWLEDRIVRFLSEKLGTDRSARSCGPG